jgi:hypothetical protein
MLIVQEGEDSVTYTLEWLTLTDAESRTAALSRKGGASGRKRGNWFRT